VSTYINLHTLQPFAVSNPNRDDAGAPKSVMYGGVQRGRISSQSYKRAIRRAVEAELDETSYRASAPSLAPVLAERILAVRPDAGGDDAWVIAWTAGSSFTTGEQDTKVAHAALDRYKDPEAEATKRDKEEAGDTLAWFSSGELDTLARTLADRWDDLAPLVGKRGKGLAGAVTKALSQIRDGGFGPTSLTIGAFGRMYANAPSAGTDGAMSVAHALTISPMVHEIDYFTAVDDLRGHGAGHLNLSQFTSGVFYRAVSLNVDALVENCATLTDAHLQTLLAASIRTIPGAKQRSALASERPLVVLAEVRNSAETYATAFLGAIPATGTVDDAIATLLDFAVRASAFDLPGEVSGRYVLHAQPDLSVPEPLRRVEDLGQLVSRVTDDVRDLFDGDR
jgi:CRISPR system Cascade subunit CasC